MPRCAFLSTDHLEDFFVYDDLVKPFLEQRGWFVEDVSWHNNTIAVHGIIRVTQKLS